MATLTSQSTIANDVAERFDQTELARFLMKKTTETNTWTSQPLECLLKLLTMSYETFKNVLTDTNVKLVQLFLELSDRQQTRMKQFAGETVLRKWSRC